MFTEKQKTYISVLSLLPASSTHKKKSKKKAKPSVSEAPASMEAKDRSVDRGFLCCTHHEVMVAGLAMLGSDAISNKGKCANIKKLSKSLKHLHVEGFVLFFDIKGELFIFAKFTFI